jgi:poly-gamma-glutamate synthesis protein (capsule biosynthesis protein)
MVSPKTFSFEALKQKQNELSIMLIRLFALLLFPLIFWSGGGEQPHFKARQSVKQKPVSKSDEPKPDPNAVAQSVEAVLPTLDTSHLRLMFAGDIMSQLPQIESAHLGNGEYDYTSCFQYIRPIFNQADLVIGNLECTLPGYPPYTGFPNFRSPDQLATALKKGGFDILVTSNNHAIDGGLDGINHTIEAVRQAGFLQTGTFKNAQRRRFAYPFIVYKNGFKIALLNYTHHTNGYRTPEPTVINRLDMDVLKKDIKEAQKMKPDLIITFLHWGDEHKLHENSTQQGIARQAHEWGSHLVVGAHPHVVQPIKNELVKRGKETRAYLTAYSLGNFISSQPFPNTEGGIVFEVNVKKVGTQVFLEEYSYFPVIRYTPFQKGGRKYYALPISPVEGHEDKLNMPIDEQEKMAAFAAKTRAHLAKFGAKEKRFSWAMMQVE